MIMPDIPDSKTALYVATEGELEPTLVGSNHGEPDSIYGQVLDHRYRIDRIIGRGAMGAVYAAS